MYVFICHISKIIDVKKHISSLGDRLPSGGLLACLPSKQSKREIKKGEENGGDGGLPYFRFHNTRAITLRH